MKCTEIDALGNTEQGRNLSKASMDFAECRFPQRGGRVGRGGSFSKETESQQLLHKCIIHQSCLSLHTCSLRVACPMILTTMVMTHDVTNHYDYGKYPKRATNNKVTNRSSHARPFATFTISDVCWLIFPWPRRVSQPFVGWGGGGGGGGGVSTTLFYR